MLILYIIKNKEGKYFRAKGYNGYGETWVDDIKDARIYAKLAPARGVVTWFTTNYPTYGIPEIHQLNITSTTILDETERVKEAINKKALKEERRKEAYAKYELECAEINLKNAKEKVQKLRKSNGK